MRKEKEKVKELLRDKPLKETKHYSKKVSAIALSLFAILFCVLSVVGVILINRHQEAFRAFVERHYLWGAIALTLLCAVQVVVALVPGEVLETMAGVVFGPWMGALICMVGITLGSLCVLLMVRRFGRRFVEAFYSREKIDSLPILRDPKKRNVMTFFLFLIPGTPKDLLTYIIGLTEMSIPLYLILTTVARIPSVISSTVVGGALGNAKFALAFWALLLTACVSGIGYGIYWLIQKKQKKPAK